MNPLIPTFFLTVEIGERFLCIFLFPCDFSETFSLNLSSVMIAFAFYWLLFLIQQPTIINTIMITPGMVTPKIIARMLLEILESSGLLVLGPGSLSGVTKILILFTAMILTPPISFVFESTYFTFYSTVTKFWSYGVAN